jgi:ABC-type amino acid transport substrate-binding protein
MNLPTREPIRRVLVVSTESRNTTARSCSATRCTVSSTSSLRRSSTGRATPRRSRRSTAASPSSISAGPARYDAVLVKDSGPIRTPKDLEGRTVAVNTLQNVGPLTINAALEKAGVDYESVKYVEVPFPEMAAALEADRVDAAWVVEPFVTQGRRSGARPVLFPFEGTVADLTVAGRRRR